MGIASERRLRSYTRYAGGKLFIHGDTLYTTRHKTNSDRLRVYMREAAGHINKVRSHKKGTCAEQATTTGHTWQTLNRWRPREQETVQKQTGDDKASGTSSPAGDISSGSPTTAASFPRWPSGIRSPELPMEQHSPNVCGGGQAHAGTASWPHVSLIA